MENNFKYVMLYDIVKHYPSLLQMVNYMIESLYRVNIERISITEKNKGRDYSSSSYTVTTNIIEDIINPSLNSIWLNKRYDLINSSNELLKNISEEDIKYFKDPIIDIEGIEDTELNKSIFISGVRYRIQFYEIKPTGLNVGNFKLDAMEQSIYLSQVTRFMEMFGNVILNFNEYIQVYEFWLWKIFKKYFKYEIIRD
jgi:hypothetical protein